MVASDRRTFAAGTSSRAAPKGAARKTAPGGGAIDTTLSHGFTGKINGNSVALPPTGSVINAQALDGNSTLDLFSMAVPGTANKKELVTSTRRSGQGRESVTSVLPSSPHGIEGPPSIPVKTSVAIGSTQSGFDEDSGLKSIPTSPVKSRTSERRSRRESNPRPLHVSSSGSL